MLRLIRPFSTSATLRKGSLELVKDLSQKKVISEFNSKSEQPVPDAGFCLAASIKYGLLRLKQQEFKYDDLNIEKTAGKQFAYKAAKGVIAQGSGIAIDSKEPNQEAAYSLIAERASKFTDSNKNIYVNSVSVGTPSNLPLDAYLQQHSLSEGQLLIHGFADPLTGGHAVALVMAVGGKTYYFDTYEGDHEFTCRSELSPDDKTKQLASEVGEKLRSNYGFYSLANHYTVPVTNLQNQLSSHVITKGERDMIDKKLGSTDWEVETEMPTKPVSLNTLYVSRGKGGELESAIFQVPSENKILKLSNVQIPQESWSQIKTHAEVVITPISIQPSTEEQSRLRLDLSRAVELMKARTFTKEEEQKITEKFKAVGNWKWKMALAIPHGETAVKVLDVTRDKNGDLQSAIFRKGGESREVFKLRFDEIPEHMRSGLKESDEEILLKANPMSPVKQAKSAKHR